MDYKDLTIAQIAEEVKKHIDSTRQTAVHALPYLVAMRTMKSINDKYYLDEGKSIVAYFLSNAQSLKGGEMPAIKKELNRRLK